MSDGQPTSCVILGGGGHARVLIDAFLASGGHGPVGILDQDPALWGKELLGVPVLGGDELLPQLVQQGGRRSDKP